MSDVRNVGVAWLKWLVANQPEIGYSEGGDRLNAIGHPGMLPFSSDCSGTSLLVYNWIGVEDPTGANPSYSGADTETWAAGGQETSMKQCIPLDAVIYGLGGPLGHQHMALVYSNDGSGNASGVITVSHGWSKEPRYVPVSEGDPTDGAYGPPRFFRYSTAAINPTAYPPGFKVAIRPGSIASKIPNVDVPTGTPPTLQHGDVEPHVWIRLARILGKEAGVWPEDEPVDPGGMGSHTVNMVIRYERQQKLAPDGKITPRVWNSFGLEVM